MLFLFSINLAYAQYEEKTDLDCALSFPDSIVEYSYASCFIADDGKHYREYRIIDDGTFVVWSHYDKAAPNWGWPAKANIKDAEEYAKNFKYIEENWEGIKKTTPPIVKSNNFGNILVYEGKIKGFSFLLKFYQSFWSQF